MCGHSPLHYAVWGSSLAGVKALLAHGARQDVRNSASRSEGWLPCHIVGCTPLHLAAVRGNVEVARALLVAYVRETLLAGCC